MESRSERNKKKKKKNKMKVILISCLCLVLIVGSFLFLIFSKNGPSNMKANSTSSKVAAKKKGSKKINEDGQAVYTYKNYKILENYLCKDTVNFWFSRNDSNKVPESSIIDDQVKNYNTHYVGNNEQKIYLTFDEDLSQTEASKTLDILKKRNIKATFFLTYDFIKANPDLVKRMVDEGHVCGNHTTTHPNMSKLASKDPTDFMKEICDTEDIFKETTGTEMSKYIRLPDGKYSEKTLDYLNQMDYKTIFWSFAYKDWNKEWNSKETALKTLEQNYHPGAIYLIHDVNEANNESLDDFITFMSDKKYSFDVVANIK